MLPSPPPNANWYVAVENLNATTNLDIQPSGLNEQRWIQRSLAAALSGNTNLDGWDELLLQPGAVRRQQHHVYVLSDGHCNQCHWHNRPNGSDRQRWFAGSRRSDGRSRCGRPDRRRRSGRSHGLARSRRSDGRGRRDRFSRPGRRHGSGRSDWCGWSDRLERSRRFTGSDRPDRSARIAGQRWTGRFARSTRNGGYQGPAVRKDRQAPQVPRARTVRLAQQVSSGQATGAG